MSSNIPNAVVNKDMTPIRATDIKTAKEYWQDWKGGKHEQENKSSGTTP